MKVLVKDGSRPVIRDTRGPLERRFWARVQKGDGCWLWTSSRNIWGYGTLMDRWRQLGAHRVSWQLAYGPIPAGLCVCHRCDVRHCVRPDHLFLGTSAENTADKMAKGRQAKGEGNGQARLSESEVKEVRRLRALGLSTPELSVVFGISQSHAHRIVAGEAW